MRPSDPISEHFRITRTQVAALKKLGIVTIEDLLRHLPARYERAGASVRTSELVPGEKVTLVGVIKKLEAKRLWKSKRPATVGTFEDGSGTVSLTWFNQPYIASYVPEGSAVKLTGTVTGKPERPYIANPEVELIPPGAISDGLFSGEETPGLYAVYPESRGITSRWIAHAIERCFAEGAHELLEDPIPKTLSTRYRLPSLREALVYVHTPEKVEHAEAARKRFAFEEIFVLQVARARERAENDATRSFTLVDAAGAAEKFLESLPYRATGAQLRAIAEIARSMGASHPMARLLEGDVGAGKTLVAAAAAFATVTSRPPGRVSGTLQVAYMAPTEILAEQHFRSFISYFEHLPINIGLLTGSGCKKFPSKVHRGEPTTISRAQLLKWIERGEIAMVIGTHALIQKSVRFQHLALAIVDEQHRFGTKQRMALAHKGDAAPHFLSMTATPIPRTLALTMYGDLDLSVLDELPPGRAAITTTLVPARERDKAYERMRTEIAKGRQAYVICPRIEEPDPEKMNALQAKSAKAEAKRLATEVFPDLEIGLLHGGMKPADKDDVMRRFAAQEIDILVATSVVEVGVNVPNATVILIEGAERFGLSQLHQLRGRVMRSSHPPYCFLLAATTNKLSVERLRALEKSHNGFELAEADLALRGPGDLYGAKQWGVSDVGMEALKNVKLIEAARLEARALIAEDPMLDEHPALRARVEEALRTLHSE